MGQESRHNLVGPSLSQSAMRLQPKSQYSVYGLIWRVDQRRVQFWGLSAVVGSTQFLADCWTASSVTIWLLAGRSVACHTHLSHGQLLSSKYKSRRQSRKSASKIEVKTVYNPIMQMTFPQLCHSLLVRNKLLEGKGLPEALNTWRWGSQGPS